jgi:hypothetical protein
MNLNQDLLTLRARSSFLSLTPRARAFPEDGAAGPAASGAFAPPSAGLLPKAALPGLLAGARADVDVPGLLSEVEREHLSHTTISCVKILERLLCL